MNFEQIIKSDWKKCYPFGGSGPGVEINNCGVLFTLDEIWDEYQPLDYRSEEDRIKIYNLLGNANRMFLLLDEKRNSRSPDISRKNIA